ncbi:GAP1-N1 domain-containing protein [Rhizobacter sp. P5_C2]
MNEYLVEQQTHGYRYGHELLASSVQIDRESQDLVDRLSDLSGPLRPGEMFEPYLTVYPLPSLSYFVIARTWQDTQAARTGCVLTRSLLVRMEDWSTIESPVIFESLLRGIDRDALTLQTAHVARRIPALPLPLSPVRDPRTGELVEALFLESRRPIVMFDAEHAESIAWRLLTALWPALRSTFSLCTFALAPRAQSHRPFDLQFAPKIARTRFADWNGRRIESGPTSVVSPRHRWTQATADQIFLAVEPSLVALDALGALKLDRRGDESALRLSLLWNELLERSENSPTAVLGLLDILRSQGVGFDEAVPRLAHLMARSIEKVSAELNIDDAWTFLMALAAKLAGQRRSRIFADPMRHLAEELSLQVPGAAVAHLEGQLAQNHSPVPDIFAGAGDGLTHAKVPEFCRLISIMMPHTVLALLAFSRRFAETACRVALAGDGVALVGALSRAFDVDESQLRARARHHTVPCLTSHLHAPLLQAVLLRATAPELARAVRRIWKSTRFEIPEFDDCFSRAVDSVPALRHSVAEVVADIEPTPAVDRFLLRMLTLEPEPVAWLCAARTDGSLNPARSASLLARLLANASDYEVEVVAQHPIMADQVATLLGEQLSAANAAELARLLLLVPWHVDELLRYGLSPLEHLVEPLRQVLAVTLLLRGLAEASVLPYDTFARLGAIAAERIDALQLANAAAPFGAPIARVEANLRLFESTTGQLRTKVIQGLAALTDRLVRMDTTGMSPNAVGAWAHILGWIDPTSRNAQLVAAATLRFALQRVHQPFSPLVVAVFPIVYEDLRGGEQSRLFDFFLFSDWDRCRTARASLVDAFVRSSWPPSDLLIVAMRSGDAQRILRQVLRESNGAQYLQSIAADVMTLAETSRHAALVELERFAKESPSSR